MRRLEDSMAGDVVDVPAGRDADASDLGRQRVGEIVAIQVGRGNDFELIRPGQHLLERDVGNRVLDQQTGSGLSSGDPAPGTTIDLHGAVKLFRDVITPVAERPFGVLHDVALVHEGDALAPEFDGVRDRAVDEPFGPEPADRFQTDADLETAGPLRRTDRFEFFLPGLAGRL